MELPQTSLEEIEGYQIESINKNIGAQNEDPYVTVTPVQSDGTFNIDFSSDMVLDKDTIREAITLLMFEDDDPDEPINVDWNIVNISPN